MRAPDPIEETLGPASQVLPEVLAELDDRESDNVGVALFGEEEASKEPMTGPVTGEIPGPVTVEMTGPGPVTGEITGSGLVTVEITGLVTGEITGPVTGEITGPVTGEITEWTELTVTPPTDFPPPTTDERTG